MVAGLLRLDRLNSAFSIACDNSVGSVLSVGSAGSVASFGSAGSVASLLSAGSVGSVLAAGGFGKLGRRTLPLWPAVAAGVTLACVGVVAVRVTRRG